ncbi:MAG: hypothetical protein NC218_02480 [Acetobacter sp.]|nr:hypothetical protein [Acetobacter sp.]
MFRTKEISPTYDSANNRLTFTVPKLVPMTPCFITVWSNIESRYHTTVATLYAMFKGYATPSGWFSPFTEDPVLDDVMINDAYTLTFKGASLMQTGNSSFSALLASTVGDGTTTNAALVAPYGVTCCGFIK